MRRYRPSTFLMLKSFILHVSSLILGFLWLVLATPASAQALSVLGAGPTGEIPALEQANEIRVIFSEPMVTLGRIPDPVTAPFFRIRPAVRGMFRWSGTTILIFTPDPDRPLPYATTYEVTIDAGATATSGRTLAAPYRFRFTTPTVRLLNTNWIRRTGRFDSPVQVFLRFNQPVSASEIFPHLSARFEKHAFDAPVIPPDGLKRLGQSDTAGLKTFEAKVASARAITQSEAQVPLALSKTWDLTRYPNSPDLIVLDTMIIPPPDAWIRLAVGPKVPAIQGRATPGVEQSYTLQLPPTLFVDGFHCSTACDPDDYNAAHLRGELTVDVWKNALSVIDITTPGKEAAVKGTAPKQRENPLDVMAYLTLEDGGFGPQPPARTWLVRIDPSLTTSDGQTLGYPWVGRIENWHQRAFTSFGDGHGVWESSGGLTLPFYARNLLDVRQWITRVEPGSLWQTIIDLQQQQFRTVPPGEGTARRLNVTPDKIQSHRLDLSTALGTARTGLVWAGVREGSPIPQSRAFNPEMERSTIVQVTNLGVTVKDSPDSTLIFVTRLDNGEPVPGANVTIVNGPQKEYWKGVTGADGVVIAPQTRLRKPRRWWEFSFIVTAEKDGDIAYVGSNWNEGIRPWEFGLRYDIAEADPLLRGSVFSDRGVYRLGEEIHFKAILREDTPKGVALLTPGRQVFAVVSDGEGREIDRRALTVNEWSSTEWTLKLPQRGALGTYGVFVSLAEPPKAGTVNPEQVLEPGEAEEAGEEEDSRFRQTISNDFLVAAFRRPEFRVDVTLTGAPAIAGGTLSGVINARYLFGAPMANAQGKYRLSREREYSVPAAIQDKFSLDQYAFVGYSYSQREEVGTEDVELSREGIIEVEHETPLGLQWPYRYTLEGDVTDVSRQHIAGRASFIVHPAPWYIGIKRPPYFVEQKNGLSTAFVAVTPEGTVTAGVPIQVSLTQTQYHSVRRAEGNGFYTWETTTEEVNAGTWSVTSGAEPVQLVVPLPSGGSFTLTARATDADGRTTTSQLSFYSIGPGYTAWKRYDHNRIDLVPEKNTYKPGDVARIMIQSPWEQATGLLTMEREGIRQHQQLSLTSTQQTVTVPIRESDIPNVYVSVLLVKGRTKAEGDSDASDPGKPSFRLGYVELKVEDATKRLSTKVKANREEYRPAGAASVEVNVNDVNGRPAQSEVTLWAVDYGVLSLTAYRTPDVLASVSRPKALQVMNEDNRQRIVSRRVLTPKGDTEGGGGGSETGVSSVRKDFRVLAFWLGSVQTDASGHASTQVKLPESLTTYRIMAVSGDRLSRFGAGESEIRINKPLLLRAAFPRFLALGDRAHFGAAVTNQLSQGGKATITIESRDPRVLTFGKETKQTIEIGAGATQEVRFDAQANALGRARVRMTVRMGPESDAFEDTIPVEVLTTKETVAAYGEARPDARETVELPASVIPGLGGLDVALSSTALVGLGEGARYVVDSPYGCAEQRSS
ncbi:MAG: alpha-2-macroglobulin family protein, partial [Acidobacteriota bacterium]